MKIDFYTKTLLTIIAVCLVIIVVRDVSLVPAATASEFRTQNSGLGTIDVRVVNTPDVNVKNSVRIDTPYNGLDVNVKNSIKIDAPYNGLDVKVINTPSVRVN